MLVNIIITREIIIVGEWRILLTIGDGNLGATIDAHTCVVCVLT